MWIPTVKALKIKFEAFKNAKSKAENRNVPMGEGISLVRDMFVADTMEEAKEKAGEHMVNYMKMGLPLERSWKSYGSRRRITNNKR